jgi:hypothetical protein
MRILGIWDEHWRASLPLPLGGVMTGNVIAWFANVDWGAFFAATGLANTAIGGAAIGLYRQWKLTSIEIRERERKLRELPIDKLDPDATSAAEYRSSTTKEKSP